MYRLPLNPRNPIGLTPQAQDIARRSGNERLVFWTSVASLGFMGVMAATATAQMVFNMVRRSHHDRFDEMGSEDGRGRARGK